jgi:O-antigen/teichoic acid export membrane protein
MAPLIAVTIWAVVPLALQRIASAALRASGRALSSQIIDGPLGTGLAVLALGALVLAGGAGSLVVPGMLYTAGVTVGAVAGWTLYVRSIRAGPKAEPVAWRPLLLMGLPVVGLNLSNAFTEWYTTVSLANAWPAAVVGQYRAAWQFVALAGLVQTAMDAMIGPRIAAAARVGAKHEIAAVARKSIVLVLLMGAPLFLALTLFPTLWLGIFGPGFTGGATALQILAIGQLVRLASGPIGTILVMTGKQRWQLGYAAAGVVTCVVLVAWLVPLYGAVGAALATGATVILRNVAAGIIVHRVLGINLFRR